MRLFKKMLASTICLTMLLSLCVFSTLTAQSAIVIREDNFNEFELSESYFSLEESLGDYFTTFSLTAGTGYRGGNRFKVVQDKDSLGRENKMMEIISTTSEYRLDLPYADLASDEIMRLYYDISLESWPLANTGTYLQLTYDNGCGMRVQSDGTNLYFYKGKADDTTVSKPVELGKWYTVVAELSYNGETSWKMKTKVLDGATGEELLSGDDGKTNWQEKMQWILMPTTDAGDIKLRMDNIGFYVGKDTDSPVLRKASVVNGESNNPRNQALKFDFYLPVSGSVSLLKEGVAVEGVTADLSGYNCITLDYEGLLDKNTPYTVSFAELGLSDITFTTENLHLWNDIEISGVTPNGAKTDISFKVSDEFGYDVYSGYLLAAWYSEDAMCGFDLVEIAALDAGKTVTKSFSLGGTPKNGDSIQLLQMDKDNGLITLARAGFIIQ